MAVQKSKSSTPGRDTTAVNINNNMPGHAADDQQQQQLPPPQTKNKKAKKQKLDHAAAAASAASASTPAVTTTNTAANTATDDAAAAAAVPPPMNQRHRHPANSSTTSSLPHPPPPHYTTTTINNNNNSNINSNASTNSCSRCAGCGKSECPSTGPLLLFEDPEEEEETGEDAAANSSSSNGSSGAKKKKTDAATDGRGEKRYCASCMTGKKVRVFWPVDSQWYIADVQQYDIHTGEHLLRYPDGDTEWVRIGEDHTTNTQYKEYYRNHPPQNNQDHGNHHLTRLPSLGGGNGVGGVSFALSQSFGLHSVADEDDDEEENDANDEKTMQLKPPHQLQHQHQQNRMYQQLNLDRTASSMSSFGMFGSGGAGAGAGGGIGARQPSYLGQHPPPPPPPPHGSGGGGGARGAPNNYQILAPNYTHSFSSKIGTVPSIEFGPPPPHPHPHHTAGGGDPYAPPHHTNHAQQHHQQHQREDGGGGGGPNAWPPNPYPNHQAYYDDRGQHPIIYPYHHPHPQGVPQHQSPMPKPGPASKRQTASGESSMSPSKKSSNKKATTTTNGDATPTACGSSSSSPAIKSRKALPNAWASTEDEHLLDLVLQMQHPLKWSVIAESLSNIMISKDSRMPPRTGKQCRERYVNHLNPRLKSTDFTPLEDATIWRLYGTIGSQWAKMAKVIPGRTDNNLKNRFHNLKRQLHREEDSRARNSSSEVADIMKSKVYVENIREIPKYLRTKIEDMWNYKRHIGLVAADSSGAAVLEQESREEVEVKEEERDGGDGGGGGASGGGSGEGALGSTPTIEQQPRQRKFGPYEAVVEPTQCGRCGLFLPSVQCGNEICTKTKWCKVCTKVSLHLTGHVLRECVNLRKNPDVELAKALETLMSGQA